MTDADLQAMMTVSRTGSMTDGTPGKDGSDIWVPFESAVVLSSGKDWDVTAIEAALQQSLAAHLTTNDLGLSWKPVKIKAGTYFEISKTRPLELAVHGKLLILSDSPDLLAEMMGQMASSTQDHKHDGNARQEKASATAGAFSQKGTATLIAGFDTAEERGTFSRWTSLVDRNQGSSSTIGGNAPSFFSGNARSLSDVFSGFQSERVIESRDGALIRQTVTYAWRH
jgi:hypothetical protein